MKPLIIVTLLLLIVFVLAAQSPPAVTWLSVSGSGLSMQSGSSCPPPAAGVNVYCGAQMSVNGSPYQSLVGPQGPSGTMTFPVTNISIVCPPGSGTIAAGFNSHACKITSP
jgi:hypothetical protein